MALSAHSTDMTGSRDCNKNFAEEFHRSDNRHRTAEHLGRSGQNVQACGVFILSAWAEDASNFEYSTKHDHLTVHWTEVSHAWEVDVCRGSRSLLHAP